MSGEFEINLPIEAKRRLFPDYPNEEQIARFFTTLGTAISLWQLVETTLYLIYERTIQPGQPGAAASAFHAIQTFNIKLAVTDAEVRFRLQENASLLAEWTNLKKKANDKSKRRRPFFYLPKL
jgi:hypothetical protein